MWIYYYCSHGPGHQSTTSDFASFDDDWSMDNIEDHLKDKLSDRSDPILKFWKVEMPSEKYLKKEIEDAKKTIAGYKRYLKSLEKEKYFSKQEKEEEDKVIKKNLRGKIVSSLIKRLHKAGLMYTKSDIYKWQWGKKCPIEPERSKILRIIRRSESYSSDDK